MNRSTAVQPLTERYASPEMSFLFSSDYRFRMWRRLWIVLAEAEKELGLPITDEQIAEMRAVADDIDYETAEAREREVRHDVMAHVHAFGMQAPAARGIIHLGATSAYVTDNTDVIQMAEALDLFRKRLVNVISKLRGFAWEWRELPTLAYTHFQPAQLTTVGKRATLWLQDLLFDYHELVHRRKNLVLLGVKGATGTQASFLKLFDGDAEKVDQLERLVLDKLDFKKVIAVSGQTYSRKIDAMVLDTLAGFAQSASKFGYDLRLLQHLREVEEPFEEKQIGSSAMAYKRNPMRSERMDALSRHLIVNRQNAALTAATQWFERTLDDSANRRIAIPEAFLAADAIALIYDNVAGGLVVHPDVIGAHVERELPFMATENLLMEAVRRGGDRQELHEKIRVHSQAAADAMKTGVAKNDLLERIEADPAFDLDAEALAAAADPERYTGLSASQTERFIREEVDPVLEAESALITDEIGALRV
ncbi:MAG: adenylosuccinate lyase [Thermoanaerobaculia bacterium]|nr:adenylosuccinate lyase [Thermoanaerobaculia bacterium]